MFRIKASYADQLELRTTLERAREFFGELRNFADLMPELASRGHDRVLVAPIQFLADHLEILYDVEIGALTAVDRPALPRASRAGCRRFVAPDLPDRRGRDLDSGGLREEISRNAEAGDRLLPEAAAELRLGDLEKGRR